HLELHPFPTRRSSDLLRLGVRAHLLAEGLLQARHLLVAARADVVLELAARALEIPRAVAQLLLGARALLVGHGGAVFLQLVLLRSEEHTSELQSRFDL